LHLQKNDADVLKAERFNPPHSQVDPASAQENDDATDSADNILQIKYSSSELF